MLGAGSQVAMLGLLQLTQGIIEKGLCMHVPAQGQ